MQGVPARGTRRIDNEERQVQAQPRHTAGVGGDHEALGGAQLERGEDSLCPHLFKIICVSANKAGTEIVL